jgi:hypothetical protein
MTEATAVRGDERYISTPMTEATAVRGDERYISTPMTEATAVRSSHLESHFNLWWASLIALCTALGLASVAVADAASRDGQRYSTSSVFFWAGILLIFVPIAGRLLMKDTSRRERLTLVVLLVLALYLVKFLGYPIASTFSDEYIHVRNTQDILRTHHLFAFNPLLPTAAYYPGLGAVTAGLVDLTGLSIFASGLVVIIVARLLFMVCLFLVAEKVTGSDRAAAGASLIYIANPLFLFWGVAFSYENLALPLAAFVVWWLGRTRRARGPAALCAAAVVIVAVTVTHHVVGFSLAMLLGTWWLVERFTQRPSAARRGVGLIALLTSTTTLMWFFIVARPAETYLFSQNVLPAFRQTVSLILGHTSPRHLYASGGLASPEWETIAGFAATGALLLALPPALVLAWRRRDRAPMVVAIVVAVLFPLSLVPRLSAYGVNISGRSSEYVFTGLGCVLGLLVTEERSRYRHAKRGTRTGIVGWKRTAVATGLITLVFIGEVTIGTPFYELLPETSHPEGYPWLVQPDVVSASNWAREHLGINQRFGAANLGVFALATYGEQNTLPEETVWPIFFAKSINESVVHIIKSARVHYLFVDWQMTKGVPATPGYYFSPQEPGAGQYKQAFPSAALKKFATTTCIDSVYHSGSVQIFDVSQIENGSCVPLATGTAGNKQASR